MTNDANSGQVKIDDVNYLIADLSEKAKSHVEGIRFSDERIAQLQNELAISDTARNGYLRAFRFETTKGGKSDG